MNRGEAKGKIVEVSIKLFNEHGVHKITTNHIIDALSISPGTLYYHYKNKEEIIRAIFKRIVSEFGFPTVDKVDTEMFFQIFFSSFPVYQKYNFFYRELSTILLKDPALHEEYLEIFNGRLEQLKQLLKQAIAGGVFRDMDELEQKYFIDHLWLHYDFRPSYNYIRKIPHATTKDLVMEHFYFFRPYLKPETIKELEVKINEMA